MEAFPLSETHHRGNHRRTTTGKSNKCTATPDYNYNAKSCLQTLFIFHKQCESGCRVCGFDIYKNNALNVICSLAITLTTTGKASFQILVKNIKLLQIHAQHKCSANHFRKIKLLPFSQKFQM